MTRCGNIVTFQSKPFRFPKNPLRWNKGSDKTFNVTKWERTSCTESMQWLLENSNVHFSSMSYNNYFLALPHIELVNKGLLTFSFLFARGLISITASIHMYETCISSNFNFIDCDMLSFCPFVCLLLLSWLRLGASSWSLEGVPVLQMIFPGVAIKEIRFWQLELPVADT